MAPTTRCRREGHIAAIWKHATETTAVEICGVLVGTWQRDANGPFVQVTESIRGEAAENKFAEVTFTHETWGKINAQMDSKFAHLSIVGWYHTHPPLPLHLTEHDVETHEKFFTDPWQVAIGTSTVVFMHPKRGASFLRKNQIVAVDVPERAR